MSEIKAVEIIQQVPEAFQSIKPKQAMFGQRRQVTSKSIELSLKVSFDSSIKAVIEVAGGIPWEVRLSPDGFIRALSQSFFG